MVDFHFLRVWWLLAVIPAILLALRLWTIRNGGHAWRGIVAPHLLSHLLVGRQERYWLRPETALLGSWILGTVALAGPTCQREASPFAEDTTVLAIVMKVTPSMQSRDIQPTRLARASEKIRDLLALRPGSRSAVYAYAGSAHRVMPLTSDAGIIETFAAELVPDVMPVEGSNAGDAIVMADEALKASGQSCWILWIADGVSPDESNALQKYHDEKRTS